MRTTIALTIGLTVLLTGCATPKSVLQYANNGVSLAKSREAEMVAFEQQEVLSEKAIAQGLLEMKRDNIALKGVLTQADVVLAAVDDTATISITKRLTDAVAALSKLEESQSAELATADSSYSKLLSPLPSTTAADASFQQKLAVFGRELTTEQRISDFAAHVKTIKKNIQDNKDATSAASAK